MQEAIETLIKEYITKGLTEEDVSNLKIASNNNPNVFKRMAQRRLFGDPIPYIVRKTIFYGRDFYVDRRVFVPDPETERLVEALLNDIKNYKNPVVLDVGTGSGAVAITIVKEIPNIKVYACDIDTSATDVASQNIKNHNADIKIFESYYVDDLSIEEPTHIIADLPWGDEEHFLQSNNLKELSQMPKISTFPPLHPLQCYMELIDSVQKKGWHPKLFFETGPIEKEKIEKIIPAGKLWKLVQEEKYSFVELQM